MTRSEKFRETLDAILRASSVAVDFLLRVSTVAACLVVLLALAVTCGPPGWADWRRADLGWRIWLRMGKWADLIAIACLIGWPMLAAYRRHFAGDSPPNLSVFIGMNIGTILFSLFIPAVATRVVSADSSPRPTGSRNSGRISIWRRLALSP